MRTKRNGNGKIRKVVINNVRYYREEAHMSQEELSLKLGKKEDFIERLESGQTRVEPTLITVDQIGKILNIPNEYLVAERKHSNE